MSPAKRKTGKTLPETAVAADSLSVSKGGQGGAGGAGAAVYAYTDPDIGQIGQGGSGSMAEIPECPVCFAYGGGGHGGGCPNAGKDQADWVEDPPAGWARPGQRLPEGPMPAAGPGVSTEDF
jgi:hypothetical protein